MGGTMKRRPTAAAAEPFDDLVISLEEAQGVAPGEYHAQVTACQRQWRFGREMLIFTFQLAPYEQYGQFHGAALRGYCNVGDEGHYAIPARSKLAKWLQMIKQFDPSISTTRVSLRVFAQYEFMVWVDLIRLDCNRRLLAPHLQYPTVRDIVRVVGKCKNPKNKKKKKTLLFSSLLSPPLQGVTP